jgi:hypothetical protein
MGGGLEKSAMNGSAAGSACGGGGGDGAGSGGGGGDESDISGTVDADDAAELQLHAILDRDQMQEHTGMPLAAAHAAGHGRAGVNQMNPNMLGGLTSSGMQHAALPAPPPHDWNANIASQAGPQPPISNIAELHNIALPLYEVKLKVCCRHAKFSLHPSF